MNVQQKPESRRVLLPWLLAILMTGIFASAGFWQLDRAAEKKARIALFEQNEIRSVNPQNFDELALFEPIQVRGTFDTERQILLDNIIEKAQVGYYVITPFRLQNTRQLLLVNRGWIPKNYAPQMLTVSTETRNISGITGHLPRAAIRPGEAFADDSQQWPKTALYPLMADIEHKLNETTVGSVLLLSATEANGFDRDWKPFKIGPPRHYAYAVQWFALALTVIALATWHTRKKP